jgi:hypothetical protein
MIRSHLENIKSKLVKISGASESRDVHLREKLKTVEGVETVTVAEHFLTNHQVNIRANSITEEIDGILKDERFYFLNLVMTDESNLDSVTSTDLKPQYEKIFQLVRNFEESSHAPLIEPLTPKLETLEPEILYSNWCYLKLIDIISEQNLIIEEENLTSMDGDKVCIQINEGSEVAFSSSNIKIKSTKGRIFMNEPPYGSYTTPKRASIAIEVFKEKVPAIIILEPKFDLDYSQEKFEERDLDKLHVIKDSIVDLSDANRERLVVGCFVTHPSSAEPVTYNGLGSIPMTLNKPFNWFVELIEELMQ